MDHPNPQKIELIVTVSEESRGNLNQIASDLQRQGLELNAKPLESLGLITGMAEVTKMDDLKHVHGVISVEKAGTMQIAPPDAEVQ